jgi:hypothetical protein
MTSSDISTETYTALQLLFGRDRPEVAIQGLRNSGAAAGVRAALGKIDPVLREAANREIANSVAGLLHIDLVDMLLAGWRKLEDLVEAARRSLQFSGTKELVDLAAHSVTFTSQPYVDVLVDGARVVTVHLALSVVFDVNLLKATVRSARMVELHSGQCDITATLAVEGDDVATRHERVDLHLIVKLGAGIPLLTDAEQRRLEALRASGAP